MLDQHQTFECMYCLCDIDFTDGPKRLPTRHCEHVENQCLECLGSYIKSEVGSGNHAQIKCHGLGCTQKLEGEDVREFGGKEVFAT
jgi:hypothetical protein